MPRMRPQWLLHPRVPDAEAARLAGATGLHPLVAAMLLRRGVDSAEAAERFLSPRLEHLHDPFALKGMDAAVARLAAALAAGERIVVSGDYDVDGVTSSALLISFLRAAGAADATYFIPNRFEHGYGLTPRTVDALLALRPALVITVDNGITALDEVARLQAEGVDTIVTDHHLPRAESVPPGIVINPQQPGCAYPSKVISGCGVTFKLVTALRRRLRETGWWTASRPEPNLKEYLDLAAIGTVADVVPLVEENRVLVHHGLQVLNRAGRRPGVEALLAVSRAGGRGNGRAARDNGPAPVTARTIAFALGPRLNAAGRMTDAAIGVELLLAADPPAAEALARRLDEANAERRQVGEAMFREAVDAVEAHGAEAPGLVVASDAFHEGIIGIVASRLVERYQRPVMVLAENGHAYKGSARSVPGVNVTEAIGACADLLEQWGGHAGAGGCTLPKGRLPDFRERFTAACERLAARAEPPAVHLEAALEPGAVTPELVEQVSRLAPFGHHNEEPQFLVEQARLGTQPEVLAERHLKWRLEPHLEMVAWNGAEGFTPSPDLRYRVRLGFNDFRGVRRIQLTVDEMQAGG